MINPYIPSQRCSLFPLKDNPECLSSVPTLRAACLPLWQRALCAYAFFRPTFVTPVEPVISVPSLSAGSQIMPRLPLAVTDCTTLPHEAFLASQLAESLTDKLTMVASHVENSHGVKGDVIENISPTQALSTWVTWSTWVFLPAVTGLFTYFRVSQV